MEIPLFERGQKLRALSRRPSHCDSFVRDAFGEVQHVDAVVKHRGARPLEVEPARIDLGEMGDQLGLEGVIALDQIVQLSQELIVGKTR